MSTGSPSPGAEVPQSRPCSLGVRFAQCVCCAAGRPRTVGLQPHAPGDPQDLTRRGLGKGQRRGAPAPPRGCAGELRSLLPRASSPERDGGIQSWRVGSRAVFLPLAVGVVGVVGTPGPGVSVCGYMSMSVCDSTWRKQEALPRRPRKQKGSKGQRGDWTAPGSGEMPGGGWGRWDSRQTCRTQSKITAVLTGSMWSVPTLHSCPSGEHLLPPLSANRLQMLQV